MILSFSRSASGHEDVHPQLQRTPFPIDHPFHRRRHHSETEQLVDFIGRYFGLVTVLETELPALTDGVCSGFKPVDVLENRVPDDSIQFQGDLERLRDAASDFLDLDDLGKLKEMFDFLALIGRGPVTGLKNRHRRNRQHQYRNDRAYS